MASHTVDTDMILRALHVANLAKEFATELLIRHDADHGRTTESNAQWATILLSSIADAERTISDLENALG